MWRAYINGVASVLPGVQISTLCHLLPWILPWEGLRVISSARGVTIPGGIGLAAQAVMGLRSQPRHQSAATTPELSPVLGQAGWGWAPGGTQAQGWFSYAPKLIWASCLKQGRGLKNTLKCNCWRCSQLWHISQMRNIFFAGIIYHAWNILKGCIFPLTIFTILI